jgi:DNA-binding transcriptional MerR regulator
VLGKVRIDEFKTLDLEHTLRCKLGAMELQKEKLTIQEVTKATGLSAHTLRYYERIGLIHPIEREENTRRRYTPEDVGWIDFLLKLRATGMSIRDMQRYAELQRQGDETLPERLEMLKSLRDTVEAHIEELSEHLKLIHYKIDIYQKIVTEKEFEKA